MIVSAGRRNQHASRVRSPEERKRYRRASSSFSRFSNNAIVLLIGSAVFISTPALRNVSSGNFDPPDLRNPRYFSTAPLSLWRTRWERVTAADNPVAYL